MIINVPKRWVEPMAITRKYSIEATTRDDGAWGCNIEFEGSYTLTQILAAADEYDATETTVAEINRLEAAITLRRLREAGADDAGGSQTGRDWMKAQEAKIATERGKL